MITRQHVDADTLASRFVEAFAGHAGVRQIWMSQRDSVSWFWVITDDLDNARELELHEKSLALIDEFPGSLFELITFSPRHYPDDYDLRASVPRDARQIA